MRFHKIIAVFVNLVFIVAGVLLWNAGSAGQWLFSISNSTVGWHNHGAINQSIFPVWASFAYLLALNAIVFFSSGRFVKKRSFMLSGH